MQETRLIMGMPVTVDIRDAAATPAILEEVFAYFTSVDERFSTYKDTSEIMRINRGELDASDASAEMKAVLALSEQTREATDGYFDIHRADGSCDPSGLVKGWAIRGAARILDARGMRNYFVDAGGDIATAGQAEPGRAWHVGIKNPFNQTEVVKAVALSGQGIATSGNYIRGDHIYNPRVGHQPAREVVSLTVIGPDVYEADRFATAAYAMGTAGIAFIERTPGLEGYQIATDGTATMTSGFERYIV